ncbi:MAG: DNA polymerase I [Spirochaetales bacterium]|nr:DNA polymerase I [Spirochaetales bacterium]
MKAPIYLLDGYSLIYRSYFAFMRSPLINKAGKNVSAIFGFFNTLIGFFDTWNPERFAVILDSAGPTFRHKQYPEYKANREKAPDDLHAQVPDIERILELMHIPSIAVSGFEADDIIATIARQCCAEKRKCYILTGDKDLMQLVNDYVHILKPDKGTYEEIDAAGVEEKWGVPPGKILELLALMGDTADNIPGVKGIGPKTAVKLLLEYETLENIFTHTDECSASEKKKLDEGRDLAFLSRELARLRYDAPLPADLEDKLRADFTLAAGAGDLNDLEIYSIASKLAGRKDASAGSVQVQARQERGSYMPVLDKKELDSWIGRVQAAKVFSFDIETDNIDEMYASPVGFSLCIKGGEACYIPLKAGGVKCLDAETIRKALRSIVTDPGLKMIGQNIKYDYKVLKRWGLEITNIWFDTMIAAWLLDALRNTYNMDDLALDYLQYTTIHFSDVVEKGQTFDQADFNQAVQYAAEDADITFRLYELFAPELEKRKLDEVFFGLEMPLLRILAEMELHGILLEPVKLEKYSSELGRELVKIEKEIYAECGREFNINSTKQLQEILFSERKLKPVKKTKTGYSTNVQVLEALAAYDVVPAMILRHRSLSKLKSTYLDTLPGLVHKETGRVHSTFLQTGTATGRLASKDPNLQNIPVRAEEGRRIRSAFKAAPGCSLISADYSQIELVILAHLSGDPGLTRAFQSGIDVHSATGGLIFGKDASAVSTDERRVAKTINFGVMYGMSAFRLSRELGIPLRQAQAFITRYFETYSGVRSFLDKVIRGAEKTGSVRTMAGRERVIPGINSRNATEKGAAERIAINTPIQGSAADIVKRAMIMLDKAISKSGLALIMLLQIHDELIFEVDDRDLDKAMKLIEKTMKEAAILSVPLNVSIEAGKSWGDVH